MNYSWQGDIESIFKEMEIEAVLQERTSTWDSNYSFQLSERVCLESEPRRKNFYEISPHEIEINAIYLSERL